MTSQIIQQIEGAGRQIDPIGSLVKDVLLAGDDPEPMLMAEVASLPEDERDELARRVEACSLSDPAVRAACAAAWKKVLG